MPEEVKVPDEKNKKGPNFLIIIIVVVLLTLVIAAGTSFLILNFLGPNLGQSSGNVGTATTAPVVQTVELLREGSRYAMMLKGGNDIAVVDALMFRVGSSEAGSLINTHRIEIIEAVRMIFLNKTRSEVSSVQGQDFIKKQINDAVNQIIGFTGERENLGVNKVIMIILTVSSAN